MSNRAARRREAHHHPSRTSAVVTQTIAAVAPSNAPADAIEPEALVVTHYFDPGEADRAATIRLTGQRVGAQGDRDLHDTFTQEDRVEGILPGSGATAVTSWVYGLQPGEWDVTAELVEPGARDRQGRRTGARSILPARWSWRRWSLTAGGRTRVTTRWTPAARLAGIPGVIPGIWPLLGALAVLVALVMQRVMLPHENVAVDVPLSVPLAALAAGLLGAKVWYAVLHPGPWRQAILGGWAVDGFLVAAPVVAVVTLLAFNLPVLAFLDAVTPGLFLAVAIGRIGCFLAGCCAGRVTQSRWGIWSSDRRIGARRIPAQILESAVGLTIATTATALILGHTPRIDGAIFGGAFVAYFAARQALLRVRAERREFLWRRTAAHGLPAVV